MSRAPGALPRTIAEAGATLRRRELSSQELVAGLLERADRLDPVLGTYLARFDDAALAAAKQADADFAAGIDRGPLQGIPLGVKDILATVEGPTTAQSLVLDRAWGAGRDAVAVARLRAAGAVLTGKTTTMEFAIGAPDPSKPFPVAANPWDTARSPGGSSSGTGNGVAAGLFLGGLGTDTGGSIRMPAAFCGISGLKVSHGRVPTTGCVPLAPSLDTIGPMARSARDCAAILQALAGPDASDPTSAAAPVDDYLAALDGSLAGVRIGVERSHTRPPGHDPSAIARFEEAVGVLREGGAQIVEVALEHYEVAVTASLTATLAEAFAWHRRSLQERWLDYGASTRTTLARGALASSADYAQAQRVRALARRRVDALFERCDAIAMPTATAGAPLLASDLWVAMAQVLTPFWNGVGLPALSVPMGFTPAGLPLGLQLAGPAFSEAQLLRVGDAYQQRTDWHLRMPPA